MAKPQRSDGVANLARALGLQIALLIATLIAFDVAAYFFLPENIGRSWIGYRSPDTIGSRSVDLRGYYMTHAERGHDIAPHGDTMWHAAQNLGYPVWSNALGCFDREWSAGPADYVYFAGDSFTWGFSPFDAKFATIFEKETGRPSLKCGVLATGQRHQFSKFLDITRELGRWPAHVIIGYSVNDIADDFLYPHLTVVSGWLVYDVYVDERGDTVRLGPAVLAEQAERQAAMAREPRARPALVSRLRDSLKRYSLISNVVYAARQRRAGSGATEPLTREGSRLVRGYSLIGQYERAGRIDYGLAMADANRQALMTWRDHAREHEYRLSVMLIPPRHLHDEPAFYDEVKAWLTGLGIDWLDMAEVFRQRRTHVNAAYWVQDAHWTPEGNAIAAQALIERWGR